MALAYSPYLHGAQLKYGSAIENYHNFTLNKGSLIVIISPTAPLILLAQSAQK